ncbi:carbon-nitrogen hydrolase family protein [Roseiconus nitratireducens]|uniref:Carbon-nitrogen hydrolase family protein n=1 Tax=Roseiconus nitratireducens TaxID=2605748 RepID=A0A5M6CYU2_9BACT|nr:carbon-nitrogen hydrolase family protein [Roseiconus nitratireducens]KAA5539590.1 carbon-nitrogen hydrolase family protein [Roseiconus nitratireducens]
MSESERPTQKSADTSSSHPVARRQFLATGLGGAVATGAGMASAAESGAGEATAPLQPARLPREIVIATVAQEGLRSDTPERMIDAMLKRCRQAATQKPDLVCLPEVFPCANLEGGRPPLEKVAGEPLCPLTQPVAEFARQHQCYVVCPTYTSHRGHFFNTAILFDREGKVAGEYHKIRLTPGEIEKGLSPGPVQPPVFDTDFGKLGFQICFDIEWLDGWQRLAKAGAEVVVWPSAFSGGRMINTMAALNRYVVVSSTRKDRSQICDIDGTTLGSTNRWHPWAVATVNLEKAFLHTWPFVQRFPEVYAKYGPKVRITTHPDEEWSILESRSPDVRIADVLSEFDLQPIDDYLRDAEKLQTFARN